MARAVCLLAAVFLLSNAAYGEAAANRAFVFVFGVVSEPSAATQAHALAEAVPPLLATGSVVELWIPGTREPQFFTKFQKGPEIEKALIGVARSAAASEPKVFLNDLDRATFALKRQPGARMMIILSDAPPKSEDAESRLEGTAAFCKENSIKVLVLGAAIPAADPIAKLATNSGGALLTDAATLPQTIASLAPVPKLDVSASVNAADSKSGSGVTVGMLRTLPNKATGKEMVPMLGLLVVETPLESLDFQDNGKGYLAHARASAVIRNAGGKEVLQYKKEITIKGPSNKLSARKKGNLCFLRSVPLPAGSYTVEGTVEDLNTGKSRNAVQSVKAADSLPGFDVSDAMLVRTLDDAVDKFESDETLLFNTTALAPLVDPIFHANQPFTLQVYFIMYPDYKGTIPQMDLDILHNGESVGHSKLVFSDKIRNTTTEGSSLESSGEQKTQFPYLANLPDMRLDPGPYEARVTVKQGRNTAVRVAKFTVAN